MPIYIAVLRGLLAYLLLRLAVHSLGNRRAGQLTTQEAMVARGLVIFAALGAIGIETAPATILAVAVTWLALFLLERYTLTRSHALRRGVLGEPTLLIYQGKLLEHNLYRKRLGADQLLSKLREKDIFAVDDVEMAVLEPEGVLTVLPMPQAQPLNKQDLLLAGARTGLASEIIVDGKIMYDNLEKQGLSEKWLRDHLRAFNVEFTQEVALATVDENGKLFVDLYDDALLHEKKLHKLAADGKAWGFADSHPLQEKPMSRGERQLAEGKLYQMERESTPENESK